MHRFLFAPLLAGLSVPSLVFAQNANVSPQGVVTFSLPQTHTSSTVESIAPGTIVTTDANSTAELEFPNKWRITLGHDTSVMYMGSPTPPPPGRPRSNRTTLIRGNITASNVLSSGATTSSNLPIEVTGGLITFLRGTSHASLERSRVLRVAATEGRLRVLQGTREVVLRQGTAMRVEPGRPVLFAHALPSAPTWTRSPPRLVLTRGEPADVNIGLGTTAVPNVSLSHFRFQIARDAAFQNVISDTTTANANPSQTLPPISGGEFFVRARVYDADRFESPWSAATTVTVGALRVVPGASGRRASVDVPRGFYCGIDGAPLTLVRETIPLSPAQDHTVRCSAREDGQGALESTVSAREAGPLLTSVTIAPDSFDPDGGMRVVILKLTDAIGGPVPYARVDVTVSDGAQVQPMIETNVRGTYTTSIRWRAGMRAIRIHFVVNNTEPIDFLFGPDLPRTSS